MRFEDYVNSLVEMLKTNPLIKDNVVVAAVDDEGNDYNRVNYTPTTGVKYNGEHYFDLTDIEELKAELEEDGLTHQLTYVICIN